jgi:hypothetical protein
VVEFQRHEGTETRPPTVMTSDRYLKQRTDDPSGLGTDAQWTFSLVPEQLHRAPLSTTVARVSAAVRCVVRQDTTSAHARKIQ